MENFKNINIGKYIKLKVIESEIDENRIANFFNCTPLDIADMYASQTMTSDVIMRWSKLLKYDFFRIFSQHLILYAPSSLLINTKKKSTITALPVFKKNIYTREVIDFILELINTGEKSKQQILEEYNIPKTTLYKWIQKN